MKHILYASDLENGSRVVLHAAIEQAIQSKGRIYFLHVSEQFHRGQDETLGGFRVKKAHDKHLESLKTEIRAYMKQRIHSFVTEELEQSAFDEEQIEVMVSFGEPAKKIVEVAEEIDAQMIVMGDRRVNALSRLFLGSTAQQVIHRASKPVLIVPISNTIKQAKVGA
ncbi:universal stress protein [Marinomonas piezotolerans]|uniref:Universal stress protein n=1 Tax=Marinomonas piezotolerans TaxID=2213058 RepID=A0A370UCL0_9GAMM|nr:universal stress protein [Marinomonas piezotolerans]RDL45536.1 universal stress protein [Marinomonas piezotolerans]